MTSSRKAYLKTSKKTLRELVHYLLWSEAMNAVSVRVNDRKLDDDVPNQEKNQYWTFCW